ncbi:hypothetical protein M011DRAFT_72770 [Sporormia fimetaria CBS 119925]|uniref:Uncharacterized protein n=1 Tax=Sporormia fimetaria CBS 119925 TaxID=1340428 RepID=A0A6A6VB78_9PLEO|nr:hypothetical protein M011DRAFT_72770 [Sporormia fimetaria CBS 119925]
MTWADSRSAYTSTPTPAFPNSTSQRRHPLARPLPPLPEPWELEPDTQDLIPAPLFCGRKTCTPPPDRIDLPARAQTPTRRPTTPSLRRNSTFSSITNTLSRGFSRSSSPALSSTSSCPSLSSRPASRSSLRSSTPAAPTHGVSRSLSHISAPPSSWESSEPSSPPSGRHPSLRRMSAPKGYENLRTLSQQDEESCLRRQYSQQTMAYLDGSISRSATVKEGRGLSIRIVEDEEE